MLRAVLFDFDLTLADSSVGAAREDFAGHPMLHFAASLDALPPLLLEPILGL